MRSRIPAVVVVVVAAAAVVALRVWLGSGDPAERLLGTLREVAQEPWSRLVFLGLYLVGPMALVPGIAFNVVAGVLWPLPEAWLWSFLGSILGCALHFGMGRTFNRQAVRDLLVHRGLGGVVAELERAGWLTVLLIRQFPLPFFGVNLAAGASPVAFRHFMLGSAIGVIPNVLIYTVLARALVEGAEGARARAISLALSAATLLVLGGLFSRWLMRRRARAALR